jgi:hypothetical protein
MSVALKSRRPPSRLISRLVVDGSGPSDAAIEHGK